MRNRWSDADAEALVSRYGDRCGRELALRTYTSRLIGAEPELVLHGGGNTSLKAEGRDVFGAPFAQLFIKASGWDLATIEPEGHVAVDLAHLQRLRGLPELSDEAMVNELRTHLRDHRDPTPSIESPVHALIPGRYVDHTHADAVLALSNQPGGEEHVRRALGDDVPQLPYLMAGFELAKRVAELCDAHPDANAMVWLSHGIVTWGESAREAYDRMIELVTRAEAYLAERADEAKEANRSGGAQSGGAQSGGAQSGGAQSGGAQSGGAQSEGLHSDRAVADERLARVAPVLRGLLAAEVDRPERPRQRVIVRPWVDDEVLGLLAAPGARELLETPPLTVDHLIRTKSLPAWVDAPRYDDQGALREQLAEAISGYAAEYGAYLERHAERMPPGVQPFDPLPRVVALPGLGVLCAGADAHAADIARDITRQTFHAKARIAAMGSRYQGLSEDHVFEMEYRSLQHAKLSSEIPPPLARQVVLVTGAAGAIGSGICSALLEAGAHLVATDLAGPALDCLVEELSAAHPRRVTGVAMDVADAASVKAGFDAVARTWGGVDSVVINAGLAHVSTLTDMDVERFRLLEKVNVEGCLLLLREAGRHLCAQGTGGDIVLISTKNVFAPGAGFSAYSATKAAAHQLARIASLELAPDDIRVNMVAPDAVFSHHDRPSGLWAEVGPGRMKARGLDAAGLEAYYRDRNLLKARITATHVANAVLYFLTRQTPTTGATLPVDGGLPDATPR